MSAAAKTKATHRGTCQACGSLQKLPAGVLSTHGYKVAGYGFFNGICRGTGHLPFEQSTGLIADMIAEATADAARLRATAQRVRAETGPVVVAHLYFGSRECRGHEKPGYRWVQAEIVDRDDNGFVRCYAVHARGEYRFNPGDRAAKVAAGFRRERADWLLRLAADDDRYVAWQTERVASWAPAPLLPVDGPKASNDGAFVPIAEAA